MVSADSPSVGAGGVDRSADDGAVQNGASADAPSVPSFDLPTAGVNLIELADEHGLTTTEALELCRHFGIPATWRSAVLTPEQVATFNDGVRRLRAALEEADTPPPSREPSRPLFSDFD